MAFIVVKLLVLKTNPPSEIVAMAWKAPAVVMTLSTVLFPADVNTTVICLAPVTVEDATPVAKAICAAIFVIVVESFVIAQIGGVPPVVITVSTHLFPATKNKIVSCLAPVTDEDALTPVAVFISVSKSFNVVA